MWRGGTYGIRSHDDSRCGFKATAISVIVMTTTLDSILKKRFHGAVNVRGIRYQVLYSLGRAFDLYDHAGSGPALRLEGIEDVDLMGFQLNDTYVQVKSAQAPWNWAKLKEPVAGFLEVLRTAPNSQFLLAVNFPLTGDIERLANFTELNRTDQIRIQSDFQRLCRKVNGTAAEADALLSLLQIKSQSEKEIWQILQREIADHFELGSPAVETYLLVLVGRFLEWAENRKTVTRTDLDNVRTQTGEALSREMEFQAYGRGLVTRANWAPDAHIDDFYDGKSTRPGHVGAGADVRRSVWLQRISEALRKSRVCVLRSSSGQGKSALALRYAYENWPPEQTVVLRVAETLEQVELIRSYLSFRASLGLPLLLLVDNAAYATRLWPQVIEQCVALGVSALIAIRTEDWQRYVQRSVTNYEIVEPQLDQSEARQLYAMLQVQQRVHSSVNSADWAFERIGKPHLLMEFVFLVTHGCMLEDRLRDQLRGFRKLGEDPAKTEILRRLSLADTLGAPVSIQRLLEDVKPYEDGQAVLNSMEGEYLQVESGQLRGLHWVRSQHIARILHEGYPSRTATALAVLPAIPPESVEAFVANALTDDGGDPEAFLAGLVGHALTAPYESLLMYVDGVFAGGERLYFQVNRLLFDDAFEHIGEAGPFILSASLMPLVKINLAANMAAIHGNKGANFQFLAELSSRASQGPRGLDLVKTFLQGIAPQFTAGVLGIATRTNGEILNWAALCKVELPEWPQARAAALATAGVFRLPVAELSTFLLGVFRYDERAYLDWYTAKGDQLLGELALGTNSLQVLVIDQTLQVSFFLDADGGDSPNEQVMRRLRILRAAVPFCERYRSEGIWCLPLGLVPTVDGTKKDIPRENLECDSDIAKNVVFRRAVESEYLPESYYRYQETWYDARLTALTFVKGFAGGLEQILSGRKFDFHIAFENGELLLRLQECLKQLSDPPPQTAADLAAALKETPKKFTTSFGNFFRQTWEALPKIVEREKEFRLPLHNLKEALARLTEMQAAFARLFAEVPDYFDASALVRDERTAYADFTDLFEAWISLRRPEPNPLRRIRAQQRQRQSALLQRVEKAFAPLVVSGISITLPSQVYEDHPLKYFPLSYSVADPCQSTIELTQVLGATYYVRDVADFFYFMPLWRGARFLEGAFCLSAEQLTKMAEGLPPNWESLVPQYMPAQLLDVLPATPFQTSRRLQVQERAQAILYAIETLRERQQRITALKTKEPSEVEQRMYDQQCERLHSLEQELAKGVFQFSVDLRTACVTSTDPEACLSFCYNFERIAQTLSSDEVVHLDLAHDHVVSALCGLEEVVISLSEEPPIESKLDTHARTACSTRGRAVHIHKIAD